MNKTKIIATVGPATTEKQVLMGIIENGVDVIRINMSHATHSYCKKIIEQINEINKELKLHVPIMLDLAGPEVRVQKIEHGEVELLPDSKIKIYADGRIGNNESISVNKEELIQYAKFNSLLKLDDGKITLQVLNKTEEYLECMILTGGVLKSGKSVNVPGVDLHLPFLSEKDKSDVLFAHKNHVDYVALSFVRDGEDILEVTDLLID